jgi:hypothetical protein
MMDKTEMSIQLGDFGEKYSQFKLEQALAGHASRQQGSADKGLDLTLHFQSATPAKRSLHCAAQVKCGSSYVKNVGERYKIVNLNDKRFDEWKSSNIPVILIWVDCSNGECYWRHITKNTQRTTFTISKLAKISPATSIDLSLYSEDLTSSHKPFQIKKLRSPLSIGIRKYGKQYFSKNLLGKEFEHPSLGKIKISWAFWRHLTSEERRQDYIWDSLSLLPTVGDAIENPGKFKGLRRLWNHTRGQYTAEGRLLIFDSYGADADSSFKQYLIRTVIRERLIYSRNWVEKPNPRSELRRELFLESIYEKKE